MEGTFRKAGGNNVALKTRHFFLLEKDQELLYFKSEYDCAVFKDAKRNGVSPDFVKKIRKSVVRGSVPLSLAWIRQIVTPASILCADPSTVPQSCSGGDMLPAASRDAEVFTPRRVFRLNWAEPLVMRAWITRLKAVCRQTAMVNAGFADSAQEFPPSRPGSVLETYMPDGGGWVKVRVLLFPNMLMALSPHDATFPVAHVDLQGWIASVAAAEKGQDFSVEPGEHANAVRLAAAIEESLSISADGTGRVRTQLFRGSELRDMLNATMEIAKRLIVYLEIFKAATAAAAAAATTTTTTTTTTTNTLIKDQAQSSIASAGSMHPIGSSSFSSSGTDDGSSSNGGGGGGGGGGDGNSGGPESVTNASPPQEMPTVVGFKQSLTSHSHGAGASVAQALQSFDRTLLSLQRGCTFTKHGRKGAPHKRFVWYDSESRTICWCVSSQSRRDFQGLNVSELECVQSGRQTAVLKRSGLCELADCYFSLIGKDRTLDLETETAADRDHWAALFAALLQKMNGSVRIR